MSSVLNGHKRIKRHVSMTWLQMEERILLKGSLTPCSSSLLCILSRYPHIIENKVNVVFQCVTASVSTSR